MVERGMEKKTYHRKVDKLESFQNKFARLLSLEQFDIFYDASYQVVTQDFKITKYNQFFPKYAEGPWGKIINCLLKRRLYKL